MYTRVVQGRHDESVDEKYLREESHKKLIKQKIIRISTAESKSDGETFV